MNGIFIIFQISLMLFIVLNVLFIFLVIRKIHSNKFERQKEHWKKYYLKHIDSAIRGKENLVVPDQPSMMDAFEEVLAKYYSLMKGNTDTSIRIEELAEQVFHNYYKKRLRHGRWSIRMNTLHRIEKFRMVSLIEDCVTIYNEKRTSDIESIQILRILANLQDDRIYSILLKEEREFPSFYYLDLFTRLDERLFNKFTKVIENFPLTIQFSLIEAMGDRGDYTYIPTIEFYLLSENAESRIRALKSLVKVGYLTDVEKIKPSLHGETWQERMMAARLIKPLRDKRFIDDLLLLLTDENWWVRTTAAESIIAQQNGQEILEDVANTHVDRFARDIATEWLFRKGKKSVVR
ncbi:HEAT repeat domain-containing protein [Pseudalkalibacillus hwajinpoensis]|uniref:HEAT repeat domain-containing protein n=1 Tax=Guptibacillus hwajinpoensis TaxID=208199 RepID=A0A4U1MC88_9BACL|nr:HEAT repeat domain-containing protein [Pseudalkalibacillus hwajinpoensis]TKD68283.1 HEAT repeat domain-containing protein [Pseudalkalibacillus hwajinpoensis]